MPDDDKRLLGKRYLILHRLGPGASGSVYLTRDTKNAAARLCAVKELDPKTRDPEERKIISDRFRDEETYLRLLNGFNGQIPKLYDNGFSEIDGSGNEKQYIVLEYFEGPTLRQRIDQEGAFNQSKVIEILVSLLPVISHIHSRGLIHRDINPSNIILRSHDGLPLLIDFGAVKEMDITIVRSPSQMSDSAPSDANLFTLFIGKPGYAAREHLQGQPVPASDLYSLGVTAIELLSGLKPVSNETDPSRWLRTDAGRNISRDFAAIIKRAVERSLDDRYPDAAKMLTDLSALPEKNERIKRRLDDSLSILLRRQPITPSEERHACEPYTLDFPDSRPYLKKNEQPLKKELGFRATVADGHKCDFRLSLRDEFCPNCGTFNLHRFSEDDLHLMHNSPEDYLKQFSQWQFRRLEDNSSLIRLGNYINRSSYQDILPSLMVLGPIIGTATGIVVAWIRSAGGFETVASVLASIVLGFLIGLASGLLSKGILFLVARPAVKKRALEYRRFVHEQGRQLARIRTRQHDLSEKLKNETENNQRTGIVLTRIEVEVSEVIQAFSTLEMSYSERLSITRSKVKEYSGASELHKDEEEFERALAEFESTRKKYQVKLLEIELLRLHNKLQTRSDREAISEKEMDDLTRVANEMCAQLASANIKSTNGKNWFERILRTREILKESAILLTERNNARVMKNRGELAITLSQKFVRTLDLLNAYVTYEDFYNEYQALTSERMEFL